MGLKKRREIILWACFGFFAYLIFSVSAFSTNSELSARGLGISEISTNWFFSGSESVRLYAPNITDFVNSSNWYEARINISFDNPNNISLNNFENMSWQTNVILGYMPHADIFLDLNSDGISDDVLVFEYAKVDPTICDGSIIPNDRIYPTGVLNTFDNKGILNNETYAWLNSGPPGPCGDLTFDNNHKSLSDWKINYSGANILKIQIEVDGWIPAFPEHESYVDDVKINGQLVEFFDEITPDISIASPSNNTNTSNAGLDINYFVSDNLAFYSCWYSNDTYSVNLSLGSAGVCANITNITWSEGIHNVIIYVNDSAGNLNSSSVSFTVDTIIPQVSLIYPQNTTYSTNVSGLNYTFVEINPVLCKYSLDNGFTNTTITCGQNATNVGSIEGSNIWTIYVTDAAGNENYSQVNFFKDSINPLIFYSGGTSNNNTNISQNWIYVNVSINETNFAGINFSLYNSTGLANLTSYATEINSINWTNLPDGDYFYNASVFDVTGNKNSTETRKITLDTIAPSVALNFPTQGSNLSSSVLAVVLNTSVNDTTSGVSNVIFSVSNLSGNVNYSSVISSGYFVNTTFDTRQLNEGQHDIRIYAYDNVGNLNSSISGNFIVDNIPPTLNSSNITGAFFNGTDFIFSPANQDGIYDSIDIIMNASELIMDWGTTYIYNSTGDKVDRFNAQSNFNNFSKITIWDGHFSSSYGNASLFVPDGFYIINTSFSDFANNTNSSVFVATIFIDNSPPAFSNLLINPNPPNEAQDVQINATITDASNITSIILQVNGKNYTSLSNNSNEFYFTIDKNNYTAHDLISYSWAANDTLGNFNISSQQFTIANKPPYFINDNGPIANFTFVENGNTQQFNLSAYFNDSDLEDRNNLTLGPLTLQNFSTYSISNGMVTLAPSLGYSGITQVAFFANDSFNVTYSNIVTINVTPVNHVPRTSLIPNITFNEDTYNVMNNTLNLSNYFFDDDGIIISYGIINQNNTGNLTISNSNGFINVSSNLNWFGNASLYFTAMDDDNEFGVSRQIFIIVNPVNDAPQINIPNTAILEDTIGSLNLSNYTTDVDSISSSFVYYVSPENASNLNCSASGSNLTYQPAANFFGQSYCNITASDGMSNSTTFRFNISVTNVNDAPNITSSAITSATEDIPYVYQINVSDADNLISPGTDSLTYSLTTSPAGMSIGSTSGVIIWLPTNSNVGNNNITIKVDDGKNGTATQSFILNVANVNDLPTVPSLISPANQTTLFVNSTTLNWSASTDDENNTITYYVFFSNSTNPTLNKSTTLTSATINGLEHNQTYYWHIISGDGIGNQTKTETRVFNVSLKNAPTITQYSPLTNMTINESNSLQFNITASDVDLGDTLGYNWTLNGIDAGSASVYNFTTNFSSAGAYDITVKVTDSFGLGTSRNWRITVSDNNVPIITEFSPSDLTPVINTNSSQNFSVFATDPNLDSLNYEWFVDGISVSANATLFVYLSNSSGVAIVRVNVTDTANNSASKTWNVTSTIVPVTGGFSGTTTNLSNANLSAVSNLVLENNFGKIFFENQIMNLTGVLDLSDSVIVANGIAAINSTNYPQLNKPATITLKGLSYNSVPEILYAGGFTSNPAEITSVCDFCNIVEYTPAPTTNGTVIFEVGRFSSFKVFGSGKKFDFGLFNGLDSCKNGIAGNLTLSIDNPGEGDSFEIGDTEKIEINVENADSDNSKKVITEISLYNINEDRVEEKIKSESATIKKDDELEFNFDLNVSDEIDEDESYLVFAKAYEKGDEEVGCVQDAVEIKVERPESKVKIKETSIKPESATPGDDFEVFVTAENIGTDDENGVYAEIKSDELGILEKSGKFNLAESGRERTHAEIIQAEIPFDAKEGNYEIAISVVSGSGKDERKIIFSVEKKRETTISQISGSSVIYLQESSEAKYSKNLNAGFIVFLIAGIIILSVLIIRRLRE
ncbi:hypothetical protein HY449_01120 [Candidatus Pacearchaeota archaeon]|nr:hypothetical protein [Candidatus Pacearchaeota archaeon]